MSYEYDLFIIGGGSGGLAAAKAAAALGAKVAVADFVKPSPAGTTWGLGGTCVNVGCIPKKLMHISSLYRETQADLQSIGWDTKSSHSWSDMVTKVDNYIKGLNWGAKTELRQKNIKYYNAFATFQDANTISLDNGKGKVETATFKYCMIACGGRPSYGGYPGAEECCISSDDIFWMKKPPGKTLVVGASYIALECAGFIAGFGYDTTVMVRSILLRGFDQDISKSIGEYMERHHVKFARSMVPSKFEKLPSGQIKVFVNDQEYGIYDTVLMAVGRTGLAAQLNSKAAGLEYLEKNGKFVVNDQDQTSVPHIYAIGDVADGKPELTPVAIQAGRFLARRLFSDSTKVMDYTDVATAVFTPIEYGTVGLSEEDARKKLGSNVKVYHSIAQPLDWNISAERKSLKDEGYMKIVCDKSQDEKVVGVHILGPNAGEVVQGLAVAVKCGVTKAILDDTVGIHPTFAEGYTTCTEEKVEGKVLEAANC
jgi:thioredoxin/glutathione reductase (selenoprotein)